MENVGQTLIQFAAEMDLLLCDIILLTGVRMLRLL